MGEPNRAKRGKDMRSKQKIIDQLGTTPIVQIACQKTGISRATYYRWRNEDKVFEKQADEAIEKGILLMNDMAESQLLAAIKDQNLTAVIFWLKNHHLSYATRVEVTAKLKQDDEQLTPEQEALVVKALKLASVVPNTIPEVVEEK